MSYMDLHSESVSDECKRRDKVLRVAHFRSYYLGRTETFIYQYLRSFTRVKPYVFTLNIENRAIFPFQELHMSLYRPYALGNLISRFGRNLLGRDFKVEALIKKFGISLIHAHFGPDGHHLLPIRKHTGIPLITTFYGYDMSILPRSEEWQKKYRKLFDIGDLFLVEGSHMKREMIRIGCPEEKLRIQHIAIDTDKVAYRARLPKQTAEKVKILFCGRFSEKKGLVYALQAVAMVVQSFPDLEFRIIGDGELRQEVEDFIATAKLERWVKLLGMQPYDVVVEELANADIFFHPSVTAADGDSEGGAPTVILEAQAAGLPILSTLHADIPEVVIDGVTGLLAPERDVPALAEKLLYLVENQELWQQMGSMGRKHIVDHYNIAQEAARLEDIYFGLVGGKE